MKRMDLAVSVAVLIFGVALLAKTQTGSVEQELIKLENEWADALVKHDWTFLDQVLADDFTFTEPGGNVMTKAQFLAGLRSGMVVTTSAVADEMKARVYGDVAVVTYRWTSKETFKGKDISGQSRWTDTWVKLAGYWKCVASHGSRIAQK